MSVLRAFDIAGVEVHPGDIIKSFRGETAVLVKLSRPRTPGKSGKVVAQFKHSLEERQYNPRQASGEYYDTVFGLKVIQEETDSETDSEMVSSAEPFMRLT